MSRLFLLRFAACTCRMPHTLLRILSRPSKSSGAVKAAWNGHAGLSLSALRPAMLHSPHPMSQGTRIPRLKTRPITRETTRPGRPHSRKEREQAEDNQAMTTVTRARTRTKTMRTDPKGSAGVPYNPRKPSRKRVGNALTECCTRTSTVSHSSNPVDAMVSRAVTNSGKRRPGRDFQANYAEHDDKLTCFRSHLEQKHYKQSSNRPTSDYRMNQNQKSQLEALIKNIPRVLQQTHNNNFQEYEKAQFYNDLKAYRSVWAIIFPENIHRCPNIPYYLDFGTDERERISGQIYDAILNEEKSVQRRAGYLSWQPNDDENKKLAVQLVSMVLDSDPAAAQRLASICHSETAFYREQASIEPHQHHSTANSAQAQSLVTDAGASVDLDSVASPLSATVDLDPDVESHHLQAQPFLDPQQEQTGPAQKPSFALDTYGGNLTMIPFSTNVELFRDQVCNTIIVSLTCGQVSISTASCMAELSLLLPLGYNVQIMYPTRHEAQFPADLAPFTPKFNFNDHMSIASDEDPTKIPFSTKVRLYRNQEYNTIIIHLICGQMSTSAAACMAELSMLLPLGFNVHIIYPTKHAAQFPADLAPFTPDFNFNDDMSIASDHMLPQQQQFYENNFNAGPSGVE
ncbi:hypothetical protein BD289DRAFT_10592 [Coniella lustricola]|uniref:Uncharacterized protein n=1 Tax=Coniella lustricola TaxID=2025994 RepID=A0A2T3A4K6_9PEZI|nr:hypothetical protein BD289DRAFT_10592 [Coniella lustricola]